jgi:2-polyprenyl-3-methyl-5-hydroxy-6-metoxy-1,4-benzoquinol methylase
MIRTITTRDGQSFDLDYFVEWRPWLWRRPLLDALEHLGDLRGKRVLEIGGRSGRMSSLFAIQGAEVTMLQKGSIADAQQEVARWNVADKVTLHETDGSFDAIEGQTFDVIFTKSVLWSVEHLDEFLRMFDSHLAEGGKVAFLENVRGNGLSIWLRGALVHRGNFEYGRRYFGITRRQHALFRRHFADVTIRRRRLFVYSILGGKKS